MVGSSSGQNVDYGSRYPDVRAKGRTQHEACRLVLTRMLKIFHDVCTDHGVSYWMTAGTLIGALRHGAMIPWDGDIDVGMTREDFAAFRAIAHRLPDDIFFQTNESDPHYSADSMPKLRDRYSNYYEYATWRPETRAHNGLQLDFLLYPEDRQGRLINPFRGTPYERDEIFPLTTCNFDGKELLAPTDPAHYIRRRYGDYMTCPPLEKRVPHEGRADPFRPCDHPASKTYPGRIPWRARWPELSGYMRLPNR